MNAIRQFIDVKNNSFNVILPKDFNADRVEVIIMPSESSYEIPQWQKMKAIHRLELYKTNPKSALDFDQVLDEIESEIFRF